MRKASVLFVAIALAMFGLAACGDDDDENDEGAVETTVEETTAGGATLEVSAAADGSLAYDQDSLSAKAGTVTLEFDNPSSTPHDVTVEDESGSEIGGTDVITDSTASTSLDLQPGAYTFFCSVPGHRDGGMEGPLTVD